MTHPQPGSTADGGMVTAVLKLTDLAARVERVEQSAARRIEELAADCAKALAQVASLREEAGTLGGRADGIEHKLGEVSALLSRMSAQIDDLTKTAADPSPGDPAAGYQVNPAPPWWQPGDDRCADTTGRLRDWVAEVYRPVFGYLGSMLAGCWDQHPPLPGLPGRDPRGLVPAVHPAARPQDGFRPARLAHPAPAAGRRGDGRRDPPLPPARPPGSRAARGTCRPGLGNRAPLTPPGTSEAAREALIDADHV
jgi:hypothetical protein